MLQAKTYQTMLNQGSVKIPSALRRLLRGADHLFISHHSAGAGTYSNS
jgi:hypothetical protein